LFKLALSSLLPLTSSTSPTSLTIYCRRLGDVVVISLDIVISGINFINFVIVIVIVIVIFIVIVIVIVVIVIVIIVIVVVIVIVIVIIIVIVTERGGRADAAGGAAAAVAPRRRGSRATTALGARYHGAGRALPRRWRRRRRWRRPRGRGRERHRAGVPGSAEYGDDGARSALQRPRATPRCTARAATPRRRAPATHPDDRVHRRPPSPSPRPRATP
jgi:hypothetical protein